MKKIIFFCVAIFAIGCNNSVIEKPSNLIEKDKMVDILYDISLLETIKNQGIKRGFTQEEINQYILKKYKIDSLQLVSSNKYYASDAEEYKKMFEKVNIPIIGIVENMAMHTCSKCGNEEHIFGSGGAEKMCRDYGVSLLGSLPLDIKIREQSDNGNPTVVAEPESSAAKTYKKIARLTAIKVSKLAQDYSNKFPNIVIQKT